MTQKKSPRCLAAVGADQKGGKEFLASSDLATPARPAQAECCANCQFFRRVALLGTSLSTSARVRWAMIGHVLTVVEVRHAA